MNHRTMAGMRHPMKVSIWLALMRPVGELMERASGIEEVPESEGGEGSEHRDIPAIIALGEALVRRGLRGDTAALNQIADRIEGKVGTRADEVDPESQARREDMMGVIESVVTALTGTRLSPVTIEGEQVATSDNSEALPENDSMGVTEADTPLEGGGSRTNGALNRNGRAH
jgi:hypothetical protein